MKPGGIVRVGLFCVVVPGCESDVSVHLLPGDHQALEVADADADSGCADGGACPRTARALYFQGPYDRVEVANSPLLDVPQDFAIEAWVFVKSYSGGHGVLNRWVAANGDIELTFGVPEPLPFAELPSNEPVPSHVLATWGFVRANDWISTVAPSLPSVGVWHHIASSYGGGSLRLYVDGVRASSVDGTERMANGANNFYIGATSRSELGFDTTKGAPWWPPIHGHIAEVRISSNNRYANDFAPEPRLSADSTTIALWHLDEEAGNTAVDSGPNHLDGAIIGPEWVDAPSR